MKPPREDVILPGSKRPADLDTGTPLSRTPYGALKGTKRREKQRKEPNPDFKSLSVSKQHANVTRLVFLAPLCGRHCCVLRCGSSPVKAPA